MFMVECIDAPIFLLMACIVAIAFVVYRATNEKRAYEEGKIIASINIMWAIDRQIDLEIENGECTKYGEEYKRQYESERIEAYRTTIEMIEEMYLNEEKK